LGVIYKSKMFYIVMHFLYLCHVEEKSLLELIKETCTQENGWYNVSHEHLHKLIKDLGIKPAIQEKPLQNSPLNKEIQEQ
jgi:hypothetical protein